MTRLLSCLALFPILASVADAAVTITIAPDGTGGTMYSFSQTAVNPQIPVEQVLSSSLRLELPPGMFSPVVAGGPGSSDTYGTFDMIGQFQDLGSSFTYDVVGIRISAVLAFAYFEFHQPFLEFPGQRDAQFNLVTTFPGILGIAPEALVEGSHSIASVLFETVTVIVIPEPSGLTMVLLSAITLMKRRRTVA